MNTDIILNKVAESGIITIDMQDFYQADQAISFDLAELLEEGILREKVFRERIKNWDIESFKNKQVAVYCSEDAIIQPWAWMLISQKISSVGALVFLCQPDELATQIVLHYIDHKIDPSNYIDQRVVVKGCGAKFVTAACYAGITQKLLPTVKSLMYGEPCSTVPIYKKPKNV